jgi:chemotaxis protein CheC
MQSSKSPFPRERERTTPLTQYTDLQLDALRELANIGSGTASTALSGMLGRSVDITVPNAYVLTMAEAVGSIGDHEAEATGVVLGVVGDMSASVLLLFSPNDAKQMCGFLGVEAGTEIGESALMEIGNIVGTSYINALASMTGMEIEPTPPATATDMLGAIVQTVLAEKAGSGDVALLLDSQLVIEESDASVSFLLVPDAGGVDQLLARLGL